MREAERLRAGSLVDLVVAWVGVDIPRQLHLDLVAPVTLAVALEVAMASEVDSKAVVVDEVVSAAVIVDSGDQEGGEVVVLVEAETEVSGNRMAMRDRRPQMPPLVRASEEATVIAILLVVGMIVVAAHMMTDVTEADTAETEIDEMPTTSPFGETDSIATLTGPRMTTTGNVGMREAMKTPASCVATEAAYVVFGGGYLLSVFTLFRLDYLSFSLLSPRVSVQS